MDGPNADAILWAKVSARLKAEFGDRAYDFYLRHLTVFERADDTLRLAVPTRFIRGYIVDKYLDRIRRLCAGEDATIADVEIVVATGAAPRVDAAEILRERPPAGAAAKPGDNLIALAPPTARFNRDFTFDSFAVAESNLVAVETAKLVAAGDAGMIYPLVMWGPPGCGKTHLMQALGAQAQALTPGLIVEYFAAELFASEFHRSLRERSMTSFKDRVRGADILLIDDIQFMANKDATLEELLHTCEAFFGSGKRIVLSASRSPNEIEGLSDRMRSRLSRGTVVQIKPAEAELRFRILRLKFETASRLRRIDNVPDEVIQFVMDRVAVDARHIEGAVNRIVANAYATKRRITVEMAIDVLSDMLRTRERKITIDDIQRGVCEHFNLRMSDLLSARRAREIARPRQIAMYICKRLTDRSLPEIGRRFGGRDHSTVIHAVRRIEELRAGDAQFDAEVSQVQLRIEGRPDGTSKS